MSEWNKLVKKILAENKKKPGYNPKTALKDALKDASKIYKKSSKKHTATPYPGKGGAGTCGATLAPPATSGGTRRRKGSSRRTKKCSSMW